MKKTIKHGTKIIVLDESGRYQEYDVNWVKEEIKRVKQMIEDVDILNDDEKLLQWARVAYRNSELYKGLDELKKRLSFLESLLKT